MKFQTYFESVKPLIEAISKKTAANTGYRDTGDLEQEICIYLWKKWQSREVLDNSKSYVMQGCWFHIRNYIRKQKKGRCLSLNRKIEGRDESLWEVIQDRSCPQPQQQLDLTITYENVLSCGLTVREKEVFDYTLKGYTTREMGSKLGISHVRVSRIQKNIRKKARNSYAAA